MEAFELLRGLIKPVKPDEAMAKVIEKYGWIHENASSDDEPELLAQADKINAEQNLVKNGTNIDIRIMRAKTAISAIEARELFEKNKKDGPAR